MDSDEAFEAMKQVDAEISRLVETYDNPYPDWRVTAKRVDQLQEESWRLAKIVWPDLIEWEKVSFDERGHLIFAKDTL